MQCGGWVEWMRLSTSTPPQPSHPVTTVSGDGLHSSYLEADSRKPERCLQVNTEQIVATSKLQPADNEADPAEAAGDPLTPHHHHHPPTVRGGGAGRGGRRGVKWPLTVQHLLRPRRRAAPSPFVSTDRLAGTWRLAPRVRWRVGGERGGGQWMSE